MVLLKVAIALALFTSVAQAWFGSKSCKWQRLDSDCGTVENPGKCKLDVSPFFENLLPKACVVTPEPTPATEPTPPPPLSCNGDPIPSNSVTTEFTGSTVATNDTSGFTCQSGFDLVVTVRCTASGFLYSASCESGSELKKRSIDKRIPPTDTGSGQANCGNEPIPELTNGMFSPTDFDDPTNLNDERTIDCGFMFQLVVNVQCTASGFQYTADCGFI